METTSELTRIVLTRIVPSRWQPREAAFNVERLWELACSIKEHGLINPVVVFPKQAKIDGKDAGTKHYELVAGERRVRALLGLAWAAVDKQVSEKEAVETLAADGIAALPDEARAALDLNAEQAGGRPGEGSLYCQILARVEELIPF